MNDMDPLPCFTDLKSSSFTSSNDVNLNNLQYPLFDDNNSLINENSIFIKEEHHELAESITRSSKFDLLDEFENCVSDLANDLGFKNEFSSSDESLASPTISQDINFAYNSILNEDSEDEVAKDEPDSLENLRDENLENEILNDEVSEYEESEDESMEADTQPLESTISPECPSYISTPQYVLVVQPVVSSVPQLQPVQQKFIPSNINNKIVTQNSPIKKFPRFKPYKPLLHIAPKKKEKRRQKRLKIKQQIEKYKKIAPKPIANVELKVSTPQPQIIVPLLKVLSPSKIEHACATVASNTLSEVVAQVPSTATINTQQLQQQRCTDLAGLTHICQICGRSYSGVISSQVIVSPDQIPLSACLACCSKLQQENITTAASVATNTQLQEKNIKTAPAVEPTPIGSAISVKLPQEYVVLQDLDTTFEYLDSVPPDPPYMCSVAACSWNSKPVTGRSDIGEFKDHYNQDHKVDLCEYCLKVFATSDKKYQHVQRWHIIPCRICNAEFLGYEKLKSHLIKRHRPYAPPPEDTTKEFQCKFCLQILYRKRMLEKHYEEKHLIYPCTRCFQLFNTTEQRLNHEFEIHEAICLLCKSSVSSEKSMKKHITVQHKQQVSDINIFRFPRVDVPLYECKFCKRELSTNLNVIYHYYWFHKKIGCEFCLAAFQTREQEYEHYKDTHTLECICCNKKFPSEQDVQSHIDADHQGQMSWFCEYCGTPCNDREMLNEHRKSHNNEDNSELLLCYVCGYQSNNQASFISHKKTHDKPKNDDYSCKICNRSFKKPGGLKLHITLKHTGKVTEKNFQCKICKRHFASMSILTLHKKRHSKYTCNICGIQYLFKLHLDEHVQEIHSRHIAHKCKLCCKMLCTENEIKLHLQCFHNQFESYSQSIEIVNVLRCQLCNNIFSNKTFVLAHIKDQHIQDKKIVKICRNKPRGRKPYLVRVQRHEDFY